MQELESDITRILQQWRCGDDAALRRLMPVVYEEMRRVARQLMAKERDTHTLQSTALVHELYLQLAKCDAVEFKDRHHLMALSARLMRRILVHHARRMHAEKRGHQRTRVDIDPNHIYPNPCAASTPLSCDVLDLEEALGALAHVDPELHRFVELRYFGGCTLETIASILEISTSQTWSRGELAKAWLFRHLSQRANHD